MVSSTFTGKFCFFIQFCWLDFFLEKNFGFNKVAFDGRKISTTMSFLIPRWNWKAVSRNLHWKCQVTNFPHHSPCTCHAPTHTTYLAHLVTLPRRRSNSHSQQHFYMAEVLLCSGKQEDIISYKKRNSSWNLEPNQRKVGAARKALMPSLCDLICIMTVYTGSFLAA